MKLATSRVLLAFASCQILAFMPAVSAQGPYEKLIAKIGAWVDARLAQPPPVPGAVPSVSDLPSTIPPDAQDIELIRATSQKVSGFLELLSTLKGDGETLEKFPEKMTVEVARKRVTPSDAQQHPIAGLQLGVLGYILHCMEVVPIKFSAEENANVDFFLQLLDECPWPRLLQETLKFFDSAYRIQTESVRFIKKSSGDQLGIIVEFTDGAQTYKYYVKTHSEGSSSRSYSSGTALNPYELFVYSVLELSDLGPEAHFFGYDPRNFYITTRDIGDKETSVQTYDGLWQTQLDHVLEWADRFPGLLAAAFQTRQMPSFVIPLMVRALVQSNVVAHLLGLTDLNGGNICFVLEREELLDYRIIDFRPIDQYYEREDDPFSAFMKRQSSDRKDYSTIASTDPMAASVLGRMEETPFLFLARYLFPEKIFSAIDEAEVRIIPILERLYPSEHSGKESEQLQQFKFLVQCVRWGAKNFSEQLNQRQRYALSPILFPKSDWSLITKPEPSRITRDVAARTPVLDSPSHFRLAGAAIGAYRSPSTLSPSAFGFKIVSPSKKAPMETQLKIAKEQARKEITDIGTLIAEAKKTSQGDDIKRNLRHATNAIAKAKGRIPKATNKDQIEEIVGEIRAQWSSLQVKMGGVAPSSREAAPSGAPSRRPFGHQRKPEDGEEPMRASESRMPGESFETPERVGRPGAQGLLPSPEKPEKESDSSEE